MRSVLRAGGAGAAALVLVLGASVAPGAPAAARATPATPVAPLAPIAAPESPVADAAREGDRATVRRLIEEGADVSAPQADGMTALHWAAESGDAVLAEMLIHAGADLAAGTRNGRYTPLHVAASEGEGGVVELLLDAGAEPAPVTTTTGVTPLHLAARAGSGRAIRALLARGVDVDLREETWEQTPLIFAADFGRVEAVRALLEAGADPSLRERVVHVPSLAAVDSAARHARDRALEAFRESAPDPDRWRASPSQVQAAMDAAREIQLHPPEQLLRKVDELVRASGGDQDLGDRPPNGYEELVGHQGGLTALLHGVREGHRDVVMALLDAGADVNRVSRGEGVSPLLMATINGHFDLALELLERGADPTLADEAGTTPLFAAVNTQWAPKARYPQQQAYRQQHSTYLEVMRAYLEAGADPNVRLKRHLWYLEYNFTQLSVNIAGATPFWRAAHAVDVDAMRLLREYGADPTIPTVKPPARRRRYGGDRDREDPSDPSGLPPVPPGGPGVPVIVAAAGVGHGGGDGSGRAGVSHRHVPDGWLPAVKYLVEELGLDVNARDHNGYTPLHFAAARGDDEMILYLVERGADVTAVSRRGHTTADMANGPVQRVQVFPETVELLESLGSKNNHNCVAC